MGNNFFGERGDSSDLKTIELIKADYGLDSLEVQYSGRILLGTKITKTSKYIFKFYNLLQAQDGQYLYCDLYQEPSSFESYFVSSIMVIRNEGILKFTLKYINEIFRFMVPTVEIQDVKEWLNKFVEILDEFTDKDYQPAKLIKNTTA